MNGCPHPDDITLLRPFSSFKVAGMQIRLRLQQNAQKQGNKTGMRYGVQLSGHSTLGEPGRFTPTPPPRALVFRLCSPEVRAKISAGVVPHNRTRTAVSQARKQVLNMWRAAIGEAAQQGGPGEVGLEWVSCRTIKYVGGVPTVPQPPRVSLPKKPRGGPRGPRSEEHRKRIADAIREKWMDPVRLWNLGWRAGLGGLG